MNASFYVPSIVKKLKNGTRSKNGMKIETLEDWTHLSKGDFLIHFRRKSDEVGIISYMEMYKRLRDFDDLSENEKQELVDFVEQEVELSLKEKITKFFTKIF
jgi:hypothetical protein